MAICAKAEVTKNLATGNGNGRKDRDASIECSLGHLAAVSKIGSHQFARMDVVAPEVTKKCIHANDNQEYNAPEVKQKWCSHYLHKFGIEIFDLVM